MVKIQNMLLQILGNQMGISTTSGVNGTAPSSSYLAQNGITQTNNNTASFAAVLTSLNKNIENAQYDDIMSSPIANYYGMTPQSQKKSPASSIVDIIVQKIKDNPDDKIDIQEMIKTYMGEKFDGSKTDIISLMSGIDNLPPQISQMQDQLYDQIVTKLAEQVRTKLYEKKGTESLYYGDDSTTES